MISKKLFYIFIIKNKKYYLIIVIYFLSTFLENDYMIKNKILDIKIIFKTYLKYVKNILSF